MGGYVDIEPVDAAPVQPFRRTWLRQRWEDLVFLHWAVQPAAVAPLLPAGTTSRMEVRVGEAIADPSPLEHFLTARWGLHTRLFGRTRHLPNWHPRWPLHRAELLSLDDELVTAAGLAPPVGPPASVLYSPGVPVGFGPLS